MRAISDNWTQLFNMIKTINLLDIRKTLKF